MELIEVLDAFVDAKRFRFATVQAHDELAPLRIDLLHRPRILVHFDLVNRLRFVVLLLRNGAGARSKY